jgi:hypothetical protein
MKELQQTVQAGAHGVIGTLWGTANLAYNTARAAVVGIVEGGKSGVKSIHIQQLHKDANDLRDLAVKAKDAVGDRLSSLTTKIKAKANDIRAKIQASGASKEQQQEVDKAVNAIVLAARIKE